MPSKTGEDLSAATASLKDEKRSDKEGASKAIHQVEETERKELEELMASFCQKNEYVEANSLYRTLSLKLRQLDEVWMMIRCFVCLFTLEKHESHGTLTRESS